MKNPLYIIILLFFISCSSKKEAVEIKMNDLENNEFSFDEIKKNKLSVFYFLAPECPLSQNYTKAINEITDKFKPKGVTFYIVFCGHVYTETEMQEFIIDYNVTIRCLKDEEYQLSSHLNANITPEVFVLDNKGKKVYSGKIDNWAVSLGIKRQITTEFYLKDAITQYLKGETILINKTEAVGCILE